MAQVFGASTYSIFGPKESTPTTSLKEWHQRQMAPNPFRKKQSPNPNRSVGFSSATGSLRVKSLATVADTSADSPNTAITKSWTINTLVSNYRGQGFAFNAVKAGGTATPGNMAIIGTLSYAYALAI